MEIKPVSTVLFCRDIKTSRRFYEETLGQKVLMDHGLNVGFAGGFALWQADFALQTIFGAAARDASDLGRGNLEIYFESDQLDETVALLQKNGVEFIHPLVEQPWGQRVIRFYDPDRHIVEVGEPMPVVIVRYLAQGMSVEEIVQRTFMPLEIVKQIAASVK